jgi:hypothetical protein
MSAEKKVGGSSASQTSAKPPHSVRQELFKFLFAAPFPRLNSSPAGFALFAGICTLFLFLSHRPLWHTDLWGHLAYGRWIVEHGALPSTEPLIPLCREVPFVDFSWLSEVIGYAAYRWHGAEVLQLLYAGCIAACVGLLAWCVWRRTRSNAAAALAAVTYVCVDWQQLAIVRPQLAGCVCFLLVFALAQAQFFGRQSNAPFWRSQMVSRLLMMSVFAAWANLHGSFLVGLATLGTFVCGRAADVLRRTGSLRAVRDDRRARRGIILLVLAMTAVLLNPYGWRIFAAAWKLSSNANLADLVEWKPLGLWMWQGRAVLIVSIGLVALSLLTPRRISTTEVLLLVGLGVATLPTSRMIVWWGPIAAYYLGLHAAAIAQRRQIGTVLARGTRLSHAYRVCTTRMLPTSFPVAALVSALVLTPFFVHDALGTALLRHRYSNLSAQTPVDVTDFLVENPPRGQIFNTMEWGDYLLWAGPPGLEVFVASHAHLVPRTVWQDYLRISTLDDGWQKILERYRVNTAIVDDDQHAVLADALREDPAWSVAHEDAIGLVFVRRRPL